MTALRFLLVAAVAFVFYLIGAKAGRGRYREIRRNAKKAWNDPTVKKVRARSQKLAKRNAKRLTKAVHH
ncbi:hypothetical protein BJQ94_13515 [Cryobacterium sp. SO2]|uniref:hypothetical protein n=1 Tax=Cryobacterium sp. SO2 TaxID=1897060 RepID=UPI00223CCF25|nr:hypothetical protein [Cryobacterium sp. SO2]WEO76377.1 hypothetical protein BJQ94_13515 [Cryobacterium sp. SO2]